MKFIISVRERDRDKDTNTHEGLKCLEHCFIDPYLLLGCVVLYLKLYLSLLFNSAPYVLSSLTRRSRSVSVWGPLDLLRLLWDIKTQDS